MPSASMIVVCSASIFSSKLWISSAENRSALARLWMYFTTSSTSTELSYCCFNASLTNRRNFWYLKPEINQSIRRRILTVPVWACLPLITKYILASITICSRCFGALGGTLWLRLGILGHFRSLSLAPCTAVWISFVQSFYPPPRNHTVCQMCLAPPLLD